MEQHYKMTYEDGRLVCEWNYENELIDEMMSREFKVTLDDLQFKRDLMWIRQLRVTANWRKGDYLYAYLKSNCDGACCIWFSKIKSELGYYDVIVEPSGYASMCVFNHYTQDTDDDIASKMYIRIDSEYNDLICETIN